ncbi:hypothetical protein Bca52824_019198 [Brassica carinata]|uniref:Replication factor A C-terminal domain-containing protein n=1 Tax=Brassica carinata TaxID=52824 RepID=A0A8X7VRJ0_BRACI|nr:hypothetical protein Bca52824_019198 [Brassica carinata]
MAMKSAAKSQLTTGKAPVAMYFNDISLGPSESQLRSRNFYGVKSKEIYRVADQSLTVSFSNGSVLAPLDDIPASVSFPTDRFRFHTHEDFQANSGLRGDLYGDLSDFELCGPVMKLYLWNQAARDFYKNFTSSEATPTVLLVTTVNPKIFAGNLSLSSMASSCVFIDNDIQPTIDYFSWLNSNPEIAKRVNADEVTRAETMTIGQIFAYIKQENAKEASFDCITTIADVVRDSAWYYIACSGCQTKATRGPSSLMCAKCGNTNVSVVVNYLAKISVYDNDDQAVFVLLGDAGNASPQALFDTIGQTHKFRVKVSKLNFTDKIQAVTVTKIVSQEVLPPVPTPTENPHDAEDGVALPSAIVADGSGLKADDGDGSSSSRDETHKTKRPKHEK